MASLVPAGGAAAFQFELRELDELDELRGHWTEDAAVPWPMFPAPDTRAFVDSRDRRLVCSNILEAWCSGLTCSPVKAEIAGSNPVASAPCITSLDGVALVRCPQEALL